MTPFRVKLSATDFAALNNAYPPSRGSADIGKRAVEIMKCYFRGQSPGCKFVDPPRGADLAVVPVGATSPTVFEVKGTAGSGIAWQQLKVSSQSSYELLTNGSASVLRVTDVYSKEPVVYELRHGQDFRLEPEPRWTFKPIRGA